MNAIAPAIGTAIDRVRGLRYENPLVTKELRTRMRGSRTQWVMLGYVLLMSVCVFYGYYMLWINSSANVDPVRWAEMRIGYHLFQILTWAQTIMIALIAPSLCAGSITIEHEQQTMEMLSMTTLSQRNIIAGKVASPMLFILMLLGISLPLAGICLMFGSISPLEMLVTYLMLIGWGFLLASAGVFFSSSVKRTVLASLLTFALVMACGLTMTIWPMDMHYGYGSGGWNMVYSAIVPGVGLECAMDSAPVFGFKLPLALVAIFTNVGTGIVLLAIAMTHLKYHKGDKTLLVRLLLLGFLLVELFVMFGNMSSLSSGNMGEVLRNMLITLAVIMSVCVPAFAAGTLARNRDLMRDICGGAVYKKMADGRPSGGLWFLVVLYLGGFLVALASLLMNPGSAAHTHSAASALDASAQIEALVQAGIGQLAWVIGTAAFAILLSSISRTRYAALAFTFAFIALSWIVLPSMTSWRENTASFLGWQTVSGFQWNLSYLWPGIGIMHAVDGWQQGHDAPRLLFREELLWLGCLIAWGIVAAGSIWLASRRTDKPGGIPLDE